MKRIIAVLATIVGFGLLPMLMAPSGGFPAFPTFQAIDIDQGGTLPNGPITGAIQLSRATAPTEFLYDQSQAANQHYGEFSWNGRQWLLGTCPDNLSGCTVEATIGTSGGLFMGSATGGDKGAGTINATALYQNGVGLFTPQAVTLSSASSKTSNSTMAVDATLQLSLVAGTYLLTMAGPAQTGLLTGQGGIQLAFGLSAANNTYSQQSMCNVAPADGTPSTVVAAAITSTPSSANDCFISAAAYTSAPTIWMQGIVTLNATTTVGIWWAQSSSNATATSLNAGTTLLAQRIL